MKSFKAAYAAIRNNADRLFASFALLGSLLVVRAGHYADNQNAYIVAAGILELIAETYQLMTGPRAARVSGPAYILSGFAFVASGFGLFGLSAGSDGEILTGILVGLAAFFLFYGDRAFPRLRVSGAFVGGWLYNAATLPLLVAGITNRNGYEIAASLAFTTANLIIAVKPKQSIQA